MATNILGTDKKGNPIWDHREPWQMGKWYTLKDADGDSLSREQMGHAIYCVNALATIPDPVAFVAAAREVCEIRERMNKEAHCTGGRVTTDMVDELYAALRRLGEVMK